MASVRTEGGVDRVEFQLPNDVVLLLAALFGVEGPLDLDPFTEWSEERLQSAIDDASALHLIRKVHRGLLHKRLESIESTDAGEIVLAAEMRRRGIEIMEEAGPPVAEASERKRVMNQLRVLYSTASPYGDLRVEEETRRVAAAVRSATHRDLVQFEHLPAVTTNDLVDGLLRLRPQVVHFSGHGSEDILLFDTGAEGPNDGRIVPASAIGRALSAVDDPPTLVVLNACRSAAQLEALLDAVPISIGMLDSVGDGDAIVFAARFYSAKAEGQSIQGAFDIACAQMELNGLMDADLPTMRHRAEVLPRTVRLVETSGDSA